NGFRNTIAGQNGKIAIRVEAQQRRRFDLNAVGAKPVADGVAGGIFRHETTVANHISHRLRIGEAPAPSKSSRPVHTAAISRGIRPPSRKVTPASLNRLSLLPLAASRHCKFSSLRRSSGMVRPPSCCVAY